MPEIPQIIINYIHSRNRTLTEIEILEKEIKDKKTKITSQKLLSAFPTVIKITTG